MPLVARVVSVMIVNSAIICIEILCSFRFSGAILRTIVAVATIALISTIFVGLRRQPQRSSQKTVKSTSIALGILAAGNWIGASLEFLAFFRWGATDVSFVLKGAIFAAGGTGFLLLSRMIEIKEKPGTRAPG